MSDEREKAWLKLHLLGGCEFQHPDGAVHLETAKTSALLAYLVMQPGAQQRHKLMGLFWGDLPEPNARRNLRHALWDLRRKLDRPGETPYIHTTRQSVTFNRQSDFWLDVDDFAVRAQSQDHNATNGEATNRGRASDFEQLREAVQLYRGDFLDGFYVRGAPIFEEWVLAERERLRGLMLITLQRLVEHHTARGEYHAGIEYTTRLLTLDPWREEVHRQLMRLLALTGQRSAALAQYEECCRLLQAELGLEPLEETTALYERLINLEAEELEIGKSVTAPYSAPLSQFTTLPFTGRGAEHATLVNLWGAAGRGEGRLALVEGQAGVGKTRLIDEMTRFAEAQGALVLRGGCCEFGWGVPYQPIAAVLRTAISDQQVQGLEHKTQALDLDEVWLTELAQLLPEIRSLKPNLPDPMEASSDTARQRLFEAVARFLKAVLGRPPSAILFLDDLHWADQSTLDLLHYLLRNLTDTPIWFVGAYRPEEVDLGHPLARLQKGLGRDHLVDRLVLSPLSGEAVGEIACTLVGEQHGISLGDLLYRESEGNAFILVETLNELQEQGALQEKDGNLAWGGEIPREILPASVQDIVLQRVGRLDKAAQHLLTLAAVIGRQFESALLQTAAAWESNRVEESLNVLLARQLIGPQVGSGAGYWDFTHDKIRAVVYHSAGRGSRRLLHQKVGLALELLYQDQIEDLVALLAYHWEQAEVAEQAVQYLLRAGDQARLVYAHEEAVDYYKRALAFQRVQGTDGNAQTARTLMRLGLTYHNAFDFQQAREAYDEGFDLWQQSVRRPEHAPGMAPHPLRMTWDTPPTLDPTMADDITSIGLINQLFSGLVNLSAEMGVVPGIARTWDVLDHGRKFVYTLRNDVRWSDGITVTAADFEYAWKRILNPVNESPVGTLLYDIRGAAACHRGDAGIDTIGVYAPDKFTLVVELEEPCGYFPQLLAQSACYPVPRHVVESHGQAWTEMGNIVTNGPFKLDTWVKGHCMILVRNQEYHGSFTGNLERIELNLQEMEAPLKLELYEAGELDVLDLPSLQVDRARQKHAGEFISFPTLYTEYLGFDTGRPPFDDRRVRQAFALASDRETLTNIQFRGYVSPATGGFVPPGIPGHSAGIGLPYDPKRARRLLAEAGYPGGRGFPEVDSPTRRAVLPHPEFLQSQWQKNLGIEISWEIMEWAPYLERLEELPDLYLMGWIADYPDPDNFLRVGLWRERMRWGHNNFDRTVETARRATNQKTRIQLYRQAEKILIEEAAIIPLYYSRQHLLVKPWVSKLLPASASGRHRWKDVVIEPGN